MTLPERPITILIAALGGEGGGVLADWIIAAATARDYPVQSTSIPGVAQRTGATTYYVEIYPAKISELGAKRPVMTLTPAPSYVDVMVASELLEAGRAMQNGFVTRDRTTLIASTHRIYTVAEKMQMGDGRFDSEVVLKAARALAKRAILFDMQAQASAAGPAVSARGVGALGGARGPPPPPGACGGARRRAGEGGQRGASRFGRVGEEVRARPGEAVHIVEFLKAGVDELAALLPRFLARPLKALAEASGLARKLNIGMHVRTTSVSGFLLLRLLAWLRPLRPLTSRWREEQALIGRWLVAIAAAAKRDAGLALEIALCGRLIKGYGDTHQRGKSNFLSILDTLVEGDAVPDDRARIEAIRKAREAALADPEGRKLELSLETHGIAPLPPKPQPVI